MMVKLLPLLYKMSGHAVYLIAGLGVVVGVDFQNKITLGSVLVAAVLVILAGIFTIRSKIATIWREEAEGERAAKERLQEELAQEKAARTVFEREQQELRHALKNEIVSLKAQNKVLETRTDLSIALEAIKDIGEHGTAVSRELISAIGGWNVQSVERDEQTHELLKEIRDKLPETPVRVEPASGVLPVHEVERRKPD